MSSHQILASAIYVAAVLGTGIAAVELAGFYPVKARAPALRQGGAGPLISLLAIMTAGLAAAAIWLGLTRLPWTFAVIGGGLALLLAPLAFQAIPRSFWDSRRGVGTAALFCGVLLLTLARLYAW